MVRAPSHEIIKNALLIIAALPSHVRLALMTFKTLMRTCKIAFCTPGGKFNRPRSRLRDLY